MESLVATDRSGVDRVTLDADQASGERRTDQLARELGPNEIGQILVFDAFELLPTFQPQSSVLRHIQILLKTHRHRHDATNHVYILTVEQRQYIQLSHHV